MTFLGSFGPVYANCICLNSLIVRDKGKGGYVFSSKFQMVLANFIKFIQKCFAESMKECREASYVI